MSSVSAELAATCSALGYFDDKSDKYYADSNTLETVKDLIRYMRKDDESHEVRRQLGATKVLQTDLLPLLKSYWEETDLFDVLLRLLVNLTTPPLMLWHEEEPTERTARNQYLQIEDHLKSYKQAFADETFWAVLSTRLSKILEIDYGERGDDNSLVIERILILIRNILYVSPDPYTEKRPDNDASVHDQVLFALHQSGMLDIILYMSSSANEKAYYMHILEILSFLLREQNASELANAALQRSEMEKIRDEAELLAIRHKETNQRSEKIKKYTGGRHSRFGGTFVVKSMKSISDNDLIYHKPLNKLAALNFDVAKTSVRMRKNRRPLQGTSMERRSTFAVRLFLKEFCLEFINGAYNTLMYYVKDNLVRAKSHAHDESYYLWAMRFFMEFNRAHKFEVKLVSETMSVSTFRYVQQLMETFFDMIRSEKKKFLVWSHRLHLALLAYRELLLTINTMDKSPDGTDRDSSRVIKNNIFYILEYREFIITLLVTYSELQMSNVYLRDLMETQHIFLKMLESFCEGSTGVVVLRRKKKIKRKKKQVAGGEGEAEMTPDLNFERRWAEAAPQLSIVLEGNFDIVGDVVPFDAASDIPIDEQKSEAMKNVQRKLRNGEFENAISLLRAAREVWPENDCFGSNNMATEEEFLALRDIFFADLGENEPPRSRVAEPEDNTSDDNEDEEEDNYRDFSESDFKFEEFARKLANPKVVRACGLALKDFRTNSINTNHCIIKLLHRIAFDCKLYVMVFQVSIFNTFQQILANKNLPQFKELVKFATYIIRQFVKVAETNKKVYMEALFWKRSNEAYEIEHGYEKENLKATAFAWSEHEEDEIRRLFEEHQKNRLEDDIVDWIVNNLVDNSRTRRGILKKMKQMNLISGNSRTMDANVKTAWSEEEEEQLRELYEEFKDEIDPLACIMARLEVKRSKIRIVDKMMEMGIIRDRSEVRKKRTNKSGKAGPFNRNVEDRRDDDDDDEEIASDSSDSDGNSAPQFAHVKRKVERKTNIVKDKPKRNKTPKPIAYNSLSKYLINLVNSGLSEALGWVKESFCDAVEDYESGDNAEGIPMVPIMDYAIDAMDNLDFRLTLKALGICPPFDEQESYWRIPGDFALEDLQSNINIIEKALDKSLPDPDLVENEGLDDVGDTGNDNIEAESCEIANSIGNKDNCNEEASGSGVISKRRIIDSDEEDGERAGNLNILNRRVIDSDSDNEIINKRSRNEVGSDAEKPKPKRLRLIISDDEEEN